MPRARRQALDGAGFFSKNPRYGIHPYGRITPAFVQKILMTALDVLPISCSAYTYPCFAITSSLPACCPG
jgi:hypothetical protein